LRHDTRSATVVGIIRSVVMTVDPLASHQSPAGVLYDQLAGAGVSSVQIRHSTNLVERLARNSRVICGSTSQPPQSLRCTHTVTGSPAAWLVALVACNLMNFPLRDERALGFAL